VPINNSTFIIYLILQHTLSYNKQLHCICFGLSPILLVMVKRRI